jgi:polyisoprenoid-binding protein YceI
MNALLALVVFAFLGTNNQTTQAEWQLDRAHSRVKFTVKHMMISEVEGSFKDFSIVFKSAKDDFSDATVEAKIKTASIDTDNERRDNHLRSDDFFNAEKYPEITFRSERFEKVGENRYKIHGDLTIRDVTKKVVFDAEYTGSVTTNAGKVSGWKATLTLNRFDYGLKWNQAIETGGLVVGENVHVTLLLQFRRPAA